MTSPYGNTLHHKENVKTGQFAFTTTEPGNYLACFWIDSADKGVGASVNIDWKIGIAAKDWDSVARKEKIEVSSRMTDTIVELCVCVCVVVVVIVFIIIIDIIAKAQSIQHTLGNSYYVIKDNNPRVCPERGPKILLGPNLLSPPDLTLGPLSRLFKEKKRKGKKRLP